jgi:hypothetical protein
LLFLQSSGFSTPWLRGLQCPDVVPICMIMHKPQAE